MFVMFLRNKTGADIKGILSLVLLLRNTGINYRKNLYYMNHSWSTRKTPNLSRGLNKGYSLKLRLLGAQNRGYGLN